MASVMAVNTKVSSTSCKGLLINTMLPIRMSSLVIKPPFFVFQIITSLVCTIGISDIKEGQKDRPEDAFDTF